MNQLPDTAEIADPFFDAVARRHPDVDLVLLAPAPLGEDEPVLDEQLAHVMMDVAALARDLWARITGPEIEPVARFAYGDDPGAVRPEARCRAERDDAETVLDRLRDELTDGGWDVMGSTTGMTRLRARRGSDEAAAVEIMASVIPRTGAVSFRVSGPSLPVGVDRARELTSNGGR